RSVTVAVWPTGSWAGLIMRVQLSRYLARPAASLASRGSAIKMTPTLSSARVPSTRPASTVAAPAVMNDVARVVNPASSDERIELPSPGWPLSNLTGGAAAVSTPGDAGLPAGQRLPLDDLGHDRFRKLPSDQRLGRGQQPVRQHRNRERLHV